MPLFELGKKPKAEQANAPPTETSQQPLPGPPTEQVISMQQQGKSNPEIVQTLQQQGYASEQIFDAMNQSTVQGASPQSYQQPMQTGAPPPGPPGDMPGMGPPMGEPAMASSETERIEELAEAIIDEKWNEIVRSINKIIDWKDRTEAKITKIEQSIEDLKKNFDSLHQGVLGKLTEYDKGIKNVSTDIKAMEMTFQKVLPTFTENVNELGRIIKDTKK